MPPRKESPGGRRPARETRWSRAIPISGAAPAADEAVHGHGGEGERLLIAVAAEAHEQRLLVEQPDTPHERMDCRPRLERLLDSLRDGDLTFAAALPAHVEAVVAGVGAR